MLIFLLFLLPILGFAAAPLTHLVIAEEYLAHHPEMERKAFLVGTVFPDIRYLGNVTRSETHEFGLTLTDISECASSFRAGMKLHSFVDEIRENLVTQWKIYDILKDVEGKHHATLLKLIEDEILYDRVDVSDFLPLFYQIDENETEFGITSPQAQKWHLFVVGYLNQKPSKLLSFLAESDRPFLNVPHETVKTWSDQLPLLVNQENIQNYVRDLHAHFSLLFH